MTTLHEPEGPNARALAEASLWRVRLFEAGAESSAEFEEWLRSEPDHEAAWDQVQRPWAMVGEAAASPELMAARSAALRRARTQGRRRWTGRRGRLGVAAGLAAAVAAVGLFAAMSDGLSLGQTYRTDFGERRSVTLKDGSRITLDSGSVVKVRYGRDARRLVLTKGQARFDVAHDVQRPFSVRAGDETVVATGTAFNIDLAGRRTVVTLIQGHVTVLKHEPSSVFARRSARGKAAPILLNPGQQLITAPAAAPRVQTASLDRTVAWESGQLVFADETLASVAERVSRYSEKPIRVDPAVAGLRISGVFNSGDVATFVDTVSRYLPVRAEESNDAVTLRQRG
jgi:transmembrane sensor